MAQTTIYGVFDISQSCPELYALYTDEKKRQQRLPNGQLNLDDIMTTNIEKLKSRYPNGFSSENSKHRAPEDI